MPRRLLCAAGGLLLALGLGGGAALAQRAPLSSDTEARIHFYQQRLGGAGTYPAYARLGAAYLQKARETGRLSYHELAEVHLLRSLEFQRNYEALRWLAVLRLEQHRFHEALEFAQEAVETLPADPGTQGVLFDIYLALGERTKAAAVAETLFKRQAGFAAYARLASLRHSGGDVEEAVEAMQRACAAAEAEGLSAQARAWCQVRLGSFHFSSCQTQQAEASYQRALEHFPGYPLALEHLAELRAAKGAPAEAIALYRTLLNRTANLHHREALAQLYDSAGQSEQAQRERDQALIELRRSVEEGSLLYVRALARLLLLDEEGAEEGLRWAQADWENRRDAYAADTLAWAYYRNGRYPEALEAIEAALGSGSREAVILFHAALIHFRLEERRSARAFLQQALACPLTLSAAERASAEKLRADLQPSPPP